MSWYDGTIHRFNKESFYDGTFALYNSAAKDSFDQYEHIGTISIIDRASKKSIYSHNISLRGGINFSTIHNILSGKKPPSKYITATIGELIKFNENK